MISPVRRSALNTSAVRHRDQPAIARAAAVLARSAGAIANVFDVLNRRRRLERLLSFVKENYLSNLFHL